MISEENPEIVFPDIDAQMNKIERGVINIFPREELLKKLAESRSKKRPLRIKLGIDPTTPDIHIGHAVPINKLKHFQDLGMSPDETVIAD